MSVTGVIYINCNYCDNQIKGTHSSPRRSRIEAEEMLGWDRRIDRKTRHWVDLCPECTAKDMNYER